MKISKFFAKLFGNGTASFADLIPDLIGIITTGSDSAFNDFLKKLFALSKQQQPLIKELLYNGVTSLNDFIKEKEKERNNPLILSVKRVDDKGLVVFIFDVKNQNGKDYIEKKPVYVITDEQIINNALLIHTSANSAQEFLQNLPEALNPHLVEKNA